MDIVRHDGRRRADRGPRLRPLNISRRQGREEGLVLEDPNPGLTLDPDRRCRMSESKETAFVLAPDTGRLIDLGEFTITVKASEDDTVGAFSLLEATEPAGFGPPMHI